MRRGCQNQNTPEWGVPPGRRKGDLTTLSDLGVALKAARKARGLTQEQLAELVDLHPRLVQKIEAGDNNMKVTTLIRIQKILGCSWTALLPSSS